MSRTMKRRASAALLLFVALSWGCDTSTEPTSSAPLEAIESAPNHLLGGLVGGLLDGGLKLVQTTVTIVGEFGSALIGPVGGLLEVQDHALAVPPGAVPHPAAFSMAILEGTTVQVDLRAVDPETGEDVGGKGFNVPVKLALSYADAQVSRRDIDRLVIVRIHEDGTREVMPSVVDKENKRVIAELDHFSKYGLCRN